MNDIEIKTKVKEFEDKCYLQEKDGGWSVPYEGIYENMAIDWVRSTLTTLTQKHEEEKAALASDMVGILGDDYDQASYEWVVQAMKMVAAKHHVDLSKTDVTIN